MKAAFVISMLLALTFSANVIAGDMVDLIKVGESSIIFNSSLTKFTKQTGTKNYGRSYLAVYKAGKHCELSSFSYPNLLNADHPLVISKGTKYIFAKREKGPGYTNLVFNQEALFAAGPSELNITCYDNFLNAGGIHAYEIEEQLGNVLELSI